MKIQITSPDSSKWEANEEFTRKMLMDFQSTQEFVNGECDMSDFNDWVVEEMIVVFENHLETDWLLENARLVEMSPGLSTLLLYGDVFTEIEVHHYINAHGYDEAELSELADREYPGDFQPGKFDVEVIDEDATKPGQMDDIPF